MGKRVATAAFRAGKTGLAPEAELSKMGRPPRGPHSLYPHIIAVLPVNNVYRSFSWLPEETLGFSGRIRCDASAASCLLLPRRCPSNGGEAGPGRWTDGRPALPALDASLGLYGLLTGDSSRISTLGHIFRVLKCLAITVCYAGSGRE